VTGPVLLVRHGETEWNLQRRYQGQSDSALTERGIGQARAIGQFLGALLDTGDPRIFASPLGRARRTAEIIMEHLPGMPELALDNRLRELSLGSWDGLTYSEIAQRSPGIFDGEGRYEWYFRVPDGECYDVFAARIGEWLIEHAERQVLVVVTHGIVTRVLRGLYAGLPREVALTLPVPQDKIFRLSGGAIQELPIKPLDASSAPAAVGRAARLGQNSRGSKSSTVPPPVTPGR
jgi:broad specificity phosphatase PhoE